MKVESRSCERCLARRVTRQLHRQRLVCRSIGPKRGQIDHLFLISGEQLWNEGVGEEHWPKEIHAERFVPFCEGGFGWAIYEASASPDHHCCIVDENVDASTAQPFDGLCNVLKR